MTRILTPPADLLRFTSQNQGHPSSAQLIAPLRRIFSLTILICLTSSTGCSSSLDKWEQKRPPLVKAGGIVTLNGTPLEEATVTLHPKRGGPAAFAQTDDDGRFILMTYKQNDGAVAGEYTASVTKCELDYEPDPIEPDAKPPLYQAEQSIVPEKYNYPASSELSVEIPDHGDTEIELVLVGEPGKLKVIADRRAK